MFLYISTYILLLSIFSLFPVRVRACCQYRENQHNCLAQRVTFNENEVMSNLHGWRYFIRARTAEAGCCSASQVCKTDSPWVSPGALRIPSFPVCPPPLCRRGLLVKGTDSFVFPGPSVLVLCVISILQSLGSWRDGWRIKAHLASPQRGPHKNTKPLLIWFSLISAS